MKAEAIKVQTLEFVLAERKVLPRLGTRKLHFVISPLLADAGIRFGRDKLFTLLSEHQLLIKPRRRYVITTNSKHFLRMHPNLTKDLAITRVEQLWVSDITYIRTDNGFCYLNLITDAYSRKIVGYALGKNMDTDSMIAAYKMALKNRLYPELPLIHHSDRGLQYCSHDYVKLSRDNGVSISMTENGDPYENALAERMNRTMKEEFGLGGKLRDYKLAVALITEGIELYNCRRPHLSLKMKTPQKVHSEALNPTFEMPQKAETGNAGEQPVRNTVSNGNGAGARRKTTAPANSEKAILVAMPEKTRTSRKTKIPDTEASGILS